MGQITAYANDFGGDTRFISQIMGVTLVLYKIMMFLGRVHLQVIDN